MSISSEIPMKNLSEIMKVKKLSEFAIISTRDSKHAARFDLYSAIVCSNESSPAAYLKPQVGIIANLDIFFTFIIV